MTSVHSSVRTSMVILGIFSLVIPSPAFSQVASDRNIGALLNEAKKSEHERKLADKQTELDRLNEDMKKGATEIESLDKGAQKAATAAGDASKQLDLLTLQKKRAMREMELLGARIDAEKLKGDGFRLLEIANRKAQEWVTKRSEENETKAAIVMAETRQIAASGPKIPGDNPPPMAIPKNEPTLTELRKKLGKAERATGTAAHQAREAMTAATARLLEAENASARAEKKREEVGLADTAPHAR